jgi:hypothetical protein
MPMFYLRAAAALHRFFTPDAVRVRADEIFVRCTFVSGNSSEVLVKAELTLACRSLEGLRGTLDLVTKVSTFQRKQARYLVARGRRGALQLAGHVRDVLPDAKLVIWHERSFSTSCAALFEPLQFSRPSCVSG